VDPQGGGARPATEERAEGLARPARRMQHLRLPRFDGAAWTRFGLGSRCSRVRDLNGSNLELADDLETRTCRKGALLGAWVASGRLWKDSQGGGARLASGGGGALACRPGKQGARPAAAPAGPPVVASLTQLVLSPPLCACLRV
jgi:hypothetical protein